MALITRISRLFTADFHAVLDRVEEPQSLLRQAIREMEDSLSEAELNYRQTLSEKDGLKYRQQELEQALDDMEGELDVCFESGQDELARDCIKRQLQVRRLAKRLAAKLGAGEKSLLAQQNTLKENRAALESMRQKAELFTERMAENSDVPVPDDIFTGNPGESGVSDNEIEVAFLQEKKRRAES